MCPLIGRNRPDVIKQTWQIGRRRTGIRSQPGVSIPVFRRKQEPLSTAAKYIVDSERGQEDILNWRLVCLEIHLWQPCSKNDSNGRAKPLDLQMETKRILWPELVSHLTTSNMPQRCQSSYGRNVTWHSRTIPEHSQIWKKKSPLQCVHRKAYLSMAIQPRMNHISKWVLNLTFQK